MPPLQLPAVLRPLRGLVSTIPVSVIPYLSSRVWPVISCQRCIIGAGKAAEPLTNSLECVYNDNMHSITFHEWQDWLQYSAMMQQQQRITKVIHQSIPYATPFDSDMEKFSTAMKNF